MTNSDAIRAFCTLHSDKNMGESNVQTVCRLEHVFLHLSPKHRGRWSLLQLGYTGGLTVNYD